MTENENVLAGWLCPRCGNTDRFQVQATTWADLTDDGAEARDIEWEDDSPAICGECDFRGTVQTFDMSGTDDLEQQRQQPWHPLSRGFVPLVVDVPLPDEGRL